MNRMDMVFWSGLAQVVLGTHDHNSILVAFGAVAMALAIWFAKDAK